MPSRFMISAMAAPSFIPDFLYPGARRRFIPWHAHGA
jgi:hypothetical protein